jgi:hypothetical protein
MNLPEKVGLLAIPEPRTRLRSYMEITCKCECGALVTRSAQDLKTAIRAGATPACPECTRRINREAAGARTEARYRGRKIGQLLVGDYHQPTGTFACECSCGGRPNVDAHRLREALNNKLNIGCEHCRAQRINERRRRVSSAA